MISLEKLHGYLNKEQSVETSARTFIFKIPEVKMMDGHIYGKYIMDGKFSFLGKELIPVPFWTELDKNYQLLIDKSSYKKNTFVSSILNQVMPEYRYFDGKSRVSFIRDLMCQIAYDMEEKSLYREMEYTRQRNNIRKNFMNFEDIDGDIMMKKIIVDYFSLTVYVIKKDEQNKFGRQRLIDKIAFVPGVWKKTEREKEYTIKNPTCFIIEESGRYNSVIRQDLNGIFLWQEEGMEDLFKQLSIESEKSVKKSGEIVIKTAKLEKKLEKQEESVEEPIIEKPVEKTEEDKEIQDELPKSVLVIPKKITLGEIQLMAEKEGISIVKKSDKTGKELKKSIQELRDEIMKKYE